MRKNLPITELETAVPDHIYLISKTDLQGRITYANQAFIEISGYTLAELLGKAHNMVRHPHMPKQVFHDLWKTLHNQQAWSGLIKNRRKDGGFYWVKARVIPLYLNGQINGYASVRTCATKAEIQTAEQLYQRMLSRHSGLRPQLHHGVLRVRGFSGFWQALSKPLQHSLQGSLLRFGALSTLYGALTFGLLWHSDVSGSHLLNSLLLLGTANITLLAYGWRVSRRMLTPLQNATHVAQQIATGNLLIQVDSASQHQEVVQLYFYLDMMRNSLTGLAKDVRSGIHASLHTSKKLTQNNQHLSSSTLEQSISLEQTTARMEQFTTTVQQTAAHAKVADELATSSLHTAEHGHAVVQDMVTTMQGIHQSSQRIGAIVSMIESIAFQTNILALNAAVESARAGQAGRSFAVVAAEVRQLAQKSAQAAGEIKSLVEESVQRMEHGAKQAEKTQNTMQNIVGSVRDVHQIITLITAASDTQALGLTHISQAITRIDQGTKDNAQLVHALGDTVEHMTNQAAHLKLAIELLNTEAAVSIYEPEPTSQSQTPQLIPIKR